MRMKTLVLAMSIALAFTLSAAASPTNEPPPLGAILDLNGTPIPGGGNNTLQSYSVDFTAALANTDITFAFREDPAFISFESASVVDLTNPSGNLLTNGDFSGGVYLNNGNANTPNGWEYANVFGASFGGYITTGCPTGGTTYCWFDGAVQAYDAIDQTIATNIGDVYRISFNLADDNGFYTTFSRVSTNGNVTGTGGNGIDATVYALAGLPQRVPEPASLVMMGVGLLGLGGIVRRRLGK